MIDIGLLKVEGFIFHHVPQRPSDPVKAAAVTPILSDTEHALTAKLEFYLRDQLVGTFSRSAQNVAEDSDLTSSLPPLAIAFLQRTPSDPGLSAAFVDLSKELAHLLYNEQHLNAPEGLMVVVRGSLGADPVLCVAKLEQQSGLSFEVHTSGGIQTVDVALEDGLVLTDKTEVFKAAAITLVPAVGADSATIEGLVSDEQSGQIYSAPISDYWLRGFLGCRYANESAVQTRSFIKAVTKAINSDIKDIGERDKAFDALQVELGSNSATIKPKEWIKKHVSQGHQDAVLKRLKTEGAPTTSFPKSAEVADRAPKYRWYEFSDGRKVKVPPDREVELVSHGEDSSKEDVLTIRGKIVRIR